MLRHIQLCRAVKSSLPRSFAHGISQARILQWVAISFSMQSSWPRDQTHVFCSAGKFFTTGPLGKHTLGFPGGASIGLPWSVGNESICNFRRPWFSSWIRKIPWGRDKLLTSVFLGFPGVSAGKTRLQRGRPGLRRSPGEGKGYPLQYSGLENSMEYIVHGVAKSQTWLSLSCVRVCVCVCVCVYIQLESITFYSLEQF